MPDYNSDREGHAEHKFIVCDATPYRLKGVHTGRTFRRFDKQGRFMLSDEREARELQQEVPRDVTVTRVRVQNPADRGRRCFFGLFPGLPWAKYDEFGKRIDKKDKEEQKSVE